MLCGGDDLVRRFRTSCFQLDVCAGMPEWPYWQGISLSQCPALNPGESHSETYGGRGQYRCFWCGARPFWPVFECQPGKPFRDRRWLFCNHCSPWDEAWPLSHFGIWHCWEGQP
jgi:hypothetical protein